MDCRRSFKWTSIYRMVCPIHNGINKSFVSSRMDETSMYLSGSYLFSIQFFSIWNKNAAPFIVIFKFKPN